MKYFIYSKEDQTSLEIAKYIRDNLIDEKSVFGRSIENERGFVFTRNHPNFVITIGGDGTLLRAIHEFKDELDSVMFIGIHTGKLGFFCDYLKEEVDQLLENLKHHEPLYDEHRLIELDYADNKFYGVNEVRVESPFNTMISQVFIDGELLENFRGNGLNFSTSIGSSAYNRSLNGPLVDFGLESILITEVAGINHNAYRSLKSTLVLSGEKIIKLKGGFKRCLVGYDHLSKNIDETLSNEIEIKLSKRTYKLMHYKKISYLKRLRMAFIAD